MFKKIVTTVSRALMITGLGGIIALAGSSAWAATQGSVGTTSTGTVGLTVTIGTLARISDLDDLDLGNFTGSGDLSDNDISASGVPDQPGTTSPRQAAGRPGHSHLAPVPNS